MLVLAVETASPAPAATLLEVAGGSTPEKVESVLLGERAAELLPRRVRELVRLAGVELPSLDRIVVATGPGSFTGLRAGVAFCRGLGRALGKPVYGFGTFEAASAAVGEPREVDFILDAGRGEVFVARRREGVLGEPVLVGRAEALESAGASGGAVDLDAASLPLAEALARLAAGAPQGAAGLFGSPLAYGRKSAAEERFGPPGEALP
jgi:tRNA threonylcarbamoyladenosine biosynthesis protein TsaB